MCEGGGGGRYSQTLTEKEKKIEHLHRLLLAGVPSQGPRHTKDVINMVPVVSLFRTQHWKRKYWLDLSQEFRYENNVMNNIFEVGGHLPLWRGWKTPNDHAEPTQTRTLKKLQSDQSKDKRVLYCVHILNIEANRVRILAYLMFFSKFKV